MKVKLKVMREVAEEHNVEWDATNFELENSKPPEDILVSCVYNIHDIACTGKETELNETLLSFSV